MGELAFPAWFSVAVAFCGGFALGGCAVCAAYLERARLLAWWDRILPPECPCRRDDCPGRTCPLRHAGGDSMGGR